MVSHRLLTATATASRRAMNARAVATATTPIPRLRVGVGAAAPRPRFKSASTATTEIASTGAGKTPTATSTSARSVDSCNKIAAAAGQQESVPVGMSLLAAALGVATVALGAGVVESATADSCLPFDASGSGQRFDQSTFLGRFSRMFLACDPRLLLYGEEEVRRCKAMIDGSIEAGISDSPESTPQPELDRRLWEAHRIASAALHPDTGDWIPRPFRMSGYVPFNGPVCVAMVASTSTPALLFWSWANQSQNALVNYYNRNASTEMSNETLAKSYAAAVGSALAVAFGLATFIQRRFDAETARKMMKYVAFPSAMVASSLNCYVVRSPEMDTGVPLVNERGEDVLPGQTSKEAAKRGVYSTTASRAMLQAPVFFVPPFLLSTVFGRVIARNPTLTVPISTYLLLVSFGFGLPATVAVFPQMSEIAADDAEEEYRALRDEKTGLPYEKFWYNKGL